MEVIIQVVEDRNYLEAQKGEVKSIKLYDLDHELNEQKKKLIPKKKATPAFLDFELSNDLPVPSKEEIKELVTLESLQERVVYKGIFRRHLQRKGQDKLLSCMEHVTHFQATPDTLYRLKVARLILRDYVAVDAPRRIEFGSEQDIEHIQETIESVRKEAHAVAKDRATQRGVNFEHFVARARRASDGSCVDETVAQKSRVPSTHSQDHKEGPDQQQTSSEENQGGGASSKETFTKAAQDPSGNEAVENSASGVGSGTDRKPGSGEDKSQDRQKDAEEKGNDDQAVSSAHDSGVVPQESGGLGAEEKASEEEQDVGKDGEEHANGEGEEKVVEDNQKKTEEDEQYVAEEDEQKTSGDDEQKVAEEDKQKTSRYDEQKASGDDEQNTNRDDEQHTSANGEEATPIQETSINDEPLSSDRPSSSSRSEQVDGEENPETAPHRISAPRMSLDKGDDEDDFGKEVVVDPDFPVLESNLFDDLLQVTRKAIEAELDMFKDSPGFDLLYNFEKKAHRGVSFLEFNSLRVLGEGGFGKVHAISKIDTGALYAQKECSKMKIIAKKRIDTVVNEVEMLKRCSHPFIVGLHHVYEDSMSIYLVLDLMLGGELKFHLRSHKRHSTRVIRFWAASLVLAIQYLHSKNIVHRDLKPANVLLDENGFVRITDFGLSVVLDENKPLVSCCGTPGYIAPEMYLGPSWDKRMKRSRRQSRTQSTAKLASLKQTSDKVKGMFIRSKSTNKVVPRTKSAEKVEHKSSNRDSLKDPVCPESKLIRCDTADPASTAAAIRTEDSVKMSRTSITATTDTGKKRFKYPRFKSYDTAVDWWSLGVIIHQMYCFGQMPFQTGNKKSTSGMLRLVVEGKIFWPLDDMYGSHKVPSMAKNLVSQLLHHDPAQRLGSCENGFELIKQHPFFKRVDWKKLEKKLVVPPFVPRKDVVNAEFQESEWMEAPTNRDRAKSVAMTDDFHKDKFKSLKYARASTYHNEVENCHILYDPSEETNPKQEVKDVASRSSVCVIS